MLKICSKLPKGVDDLRNLIKVKVNTFNCILFLSKAVLYILFFLFSNFDWCFASNNNKKI